MSDFGPAVDFLLQNEGGELVTQDHGRGPSRWGVTLKTAQELHPDWTADDIANLTREGARMFYWGWLWEGRKIGMIQDQRLATKVFDIGANMGPGTAIRILQQAAGVTQDGILGPLTAAKVNAADPGILLEDFIRVGGAHYRAIVANDPTLAPNLQGWVARLNREVPTSPQGA